MTQFEAYLVRLMLAFKQTKQLREMQVIHVIREKYKELKDKPDLTDDEMGQLADEIKRITEKGERICR